MTTTTRTILRAAAAAVAALTLAACGSASTADDAGAAPAVSASDAWVKTADSGMTAAFLTLSNPTDEPVVLASVSTPAAGMVELHEMAMQDGQMVMQPKEGGIAVPAGGSAVLEPGGDHIMLMQLTGPIAAGDVVTLTLSFDTGESLVVEATAKDFDGGNESYQPSPSASMQGM